MLTTSPPPLRRRRLLGLAAAAPLGACASAGFQPHPGQGPLAPDGIFVMPDAEVLPYRLWQPAGETERVVLALHGFNDSRDAWEIPAPEFAAGGALVYAPDQRGFGATAGRGFWPGAEALVADAAAMVGRLHARHPDLPLFVMGESMGGAVAMRLAVSGRAPDVAGFVLLAPAVWGRARMNVFIRSGLWLAYNVAPSYTAISPPGVRVRASDNDAALRRLARDPLTIHATRIDTAKGLVDLMDEALAAAPALDSRALFLYGGKDELVPPEATAATWRALPASTHGEGTRTAYYPNGYHLLLRDLDRARPIGDALAWMRAPAAALPSGADEAARAWLTDRA